MAVSASDWTSPDGLICFTDSPATSIREPPGSTSLSKKRTLSIEIKARALSPTPSASRSSIPPAPLTTHLTLAPYLPSPSSGLLSSALAGVRVVGASSLSSGLSNALRSQSGIPCIAVGKTDMSGAPLSPLSSNTPMAMNLTEAMVMPPRKFPKKYDGHAAGSSDSEEDEFDSSAMQLSVRDPHFIAPHMMLSMSMPNADADFGRGAFRPGSVMEGRGRKLSGIDASRVRNNILRQTGFLEPGDNPLSSGSVSGGP